MRCLPTSLLALLAVSVSGVVAVIDFSFYPVAAQDCMYKASNSSNCDSASVTDTNKCLCSNGGNFVTDTAKCLGTSASSEVSTVYKTMKQACADSKTPLSISEQQFLSAASTKSSTSSSSSRTSTSSSTSTSQTSSTSDATPNPTGSQEPQEKKSNGLSTGALAGIISGGAIVGIAVISGIVVLLLRRRKRKDEEESHPMLAHGHNPSGQNFYPTPGQTVVVGHDMGRNSGAGSWSNDAKWRPAGSPDPRNSTFNWESPYDPAGSPPIKQGFQTPPTQHGFPSPPPQGGFPTPPPPLQQGFAAPGQQFKAYQPPLPSPQPAAPQPPVFELGSNQLPAEAPGSTIPTSTVVEMDGTPVPPHGFEPRPEHGYPPQFGGAAYR
ncbi:hypothetical protein B0T16DRAFT_415861 [Cercophora newfieldiana]|uniref:Extracellular membrane protein CFEM domain-containing protein n=1 Tax=Cercophora newfieldiana TaxID=92897 RepID=A0AA40CM28_9PEZI|nr:hypothetical protein B0T16DRAFT_415861 [Cercophora newfieldiana]